MRVDYPQVTFDIGPLLQLSLLTNTALTIFGLRSLGIVGWRLSRGIGGVAGFGVRNGVGLLRFRLCACMLGTAVLYLLVFLKL